MKYIVLYIFLLIANILFGQETFLKGMVIDAKNKKGLANVTVYNISTNQGTVTGLGGKFNISVKPKEKLVFNYLGYKEHVYKITHKNNITVYLQQEEEFLDEVVIVAKKNINDIALRKATGVTANIEVAKLEKRATSNIMESLQGQVAGLTIKSDGELGKPLKIRIRGTSTLPIKTNGVKEEDRILFDNKANGPLFVLDGQVISANAFETLNVNDVKEIKILKDAMANALYGVKAANGVIEITSKRGVNGKTTYSFSLQQGITFRGNPSQLMMETEEKLNFERLSKNPKTPGYRNSEEYIRIKNPNAININELIAQGKRRLDSIKRINTNWFHELSRMSMYKSYNLSSRGGSKNTRFYISGNFTKQGGKFDGNQIERFTGRSNYEYNVSKNIYVMLNSGFGFSESTTPHSSNYSPTSLIYQLNPYEEKEKGRLISYPNRTFKNLINQYRKSEVDSRFNFSANITATLAKDLYVSSIIGMDYLATESLAITPPTAYSEISSGFPVKERGKVSKRKLITTNFTANTRVNYTKEFGEHHISLSGNTDYYKNSNDFIGIAGYGLPSKLLSGAGINNDITGTRKSVTSSSKTTDAVLGYGVSALYVWNDKVDIYGSYKRDGASLLPNHKRWNTFWAVGAGYQFSKNEKGTISNLKLRGSYGITASLSGITPSLIVPTFTYGTNGYQGIRELYVKSLFNKEVVPEKNTSVNLGIDIGLFSNINANVEVYHRRTDNMLLTVPIAPSNGFTEQLKNIGVMDNQGVEFTINATPINTTCFTWMTTANIAYNKNIVVDLYEGKTLNLSGNPYPDYEEGKPADLIYGLVSLGINAADGTPIFQRKDGSILNGISGKPEKDDFVILGYATPPYTGGWYHNFIYEGWQVSFDLYYSFGGKAVYTNQTKVYDAADSYRNLPKGHLDKTWFTPGDDHKTYKSLFLNGNNFYETAQYANTNTIGSTNFIRLNNIMLRYRFSDSYLRKIGSSFIKNWTMYAQLKNIATWSSFKGGDPESANLQGSSQPIFTVGTNLTF
ncbi:SusC/RagA family TonB-linked outer membrane protein [Tenacibaculum maritimum]|uniref:SusC/RagA family TonB-linked outer membrane protein n=1 Tax=Tenacibaculum maritimum TaxID=107401 RepID=UPI003876427B